MKEAHICIYTFGKLSVERKREDGTWETVAPLTQGPVTHENHTKSVLGYLLCCCGRRALRGQIALDLWGSESVSGEEYLQKATTRLRRLLGGEPSFQLTENKKRYALADQSQIWTDRDHCIALMAEVEEVGRTTRAAIARLEEAERLFRRGAFLEEEASSWFHAPRGELTTLFYRCRQYLVEAYQTQGMYPQEECIAEAWLREDPFDETALRHLMQSLHEQEMTHEAQRRYRETAALAKKMGNELSSEMEAFAQRLPYQPRGQCGAASPKQEEAKASPRLANLLPDPEKQITVASSDQAVVIYGSHIRVFALQNEPQKSIPQGLLATSPYLVESSAKNEESSPSSDVPFEGTMEIDTDLEGEDPMEAERREILHMLKSLGLVGATTGIPVIGEQDLIADVRDALYPSGPGDKELKLLEQKIMFYWQARHNVIIAPTDLQLHVKAYIREVTILLKRSLMPSIRTRLCVCLSQGMLLTGACFYGMGQFQMARVYFQTAGESAHEAKHNILQALAWGYDAFSWLNSDEAGWYEHARDSRLKACGFASLGSDLAVECWAQAGLAQVYARRDEKVACLEALKEAGKLNQRVPGDWYYIHQFGLPKLNGDRGLCLQQLYRPDDPDAASLLEEAEQVLKEALSQPNVVPLRWAFHVVDMAQVQARKGDVEAACDYARQVVDIAGTDNPLWQRLLTVRTHLEPYADVQAVKDLDAEIRTLSLPGMQ